MPLLFLVRSPYQPEITQLLLLHPLITKAVLYRLS